jgi:hypothetical protein
MLMFYFCYYELIVCEIDVQIQANPFQEVFQIPIFSKKMKKRQIL